MDIEYHYYITYIIALRAGFDRDTAYKIASSSQYTDDNKKQYVINERKKDEFSNHISQTKNIFKPEDKLLRIFVFFHFFPGTEQEILKAPPRKDGKLHLLNTIPGNAQAQDLLSRALKTGDPYRIGLATHTFSDTYAHQNFVGVKDKFNAMKRVDQILNIIDIGHSDAIEDPDKPGLIWDDNRLVERERTINNKDRFISATENLFDMYWDHIMTRQSSRKRQKDNLIRDINKAIGKVNKKDGDGKEKRTKRYIKLIGDNLVNDYDGKAWFKDAVRGRMIDTGETRPERGPVKKLCYFWKRKDSDWYQFQKAVKVHQDTAADILSPVLEKMEIETIQNW